MGIHGDGPTFETSLKQLVYRNSRCKHSVMIFSSKMRSSTLVIILIFVTRKKEERLSQLMHEHGTVHMQGWLNSQI